MTNTPDTTSTGPDRWVLGIVGAFAVLFAVYAGFIYLALSDAPEIEASYIQADR